MNLFAAISLLLVFGCGEDEIKTETERVRLALNWFQRLSMVDSTLRRFTVFTPKKYRSGNTGGGPDAPVIQRVATGGGVRCHKCR